MKRNKTDTGERLFQEAYALLKKEPESRLESDRKFLKPLNEACRLDNPKAEFVSGYLLCLGYKDLDVDVKKGKKILSKCYGLLNSLAEENHDPQACVFLAEYYRVPLAGYIKDDAKVKAYLSLADTYKNNEAAQTKVGDESDFTSSDIIDGVSSDLEADASSYDQLVRTIGELKSLTPFENQERISTLKTSAESGNMRASLFLGQAYLEGKYVIKDADLAKIYLQLAEKQGSVKARFLLGRIYTEGNFSRQDVIRGLNKIYQAAKAGLSEAQLYLGKIYLSGQDVEKDVSKAYLYFQAAYSRGNKEAGKYLLQIDSEHGDKVLVSSSASKLSH